MTFDELERSQQWYEIDLGENKFSVNGNNVDLLLKADTNLVMLPSKEVINKAFIRCIKKDFNTTKDKIKLNLLEK